MRGWRGWGGGCAALEAGWGFSSDLTALTALCKARTEDFSLLESRLANLCQNLVEPKDLNNYVIS